MTEINTPPEPPEPKTVEIPETARTLPSGEREFMLDVSTSDLEVNMGPQHPATHGVMRILIRTDGEVVTGGRRIERPGFFVEPTIVRAPPQELQAQGLRRRVRGVERGEPLPAAVAGEDDNHNCFFFQVCQGMRVSVDTRNIFPLRSFVADIQNRIELAGKR